MGTPFKMKGSPMARNFGAPFKANKSVVEKFIESRVERVINNVKNVVDNISGKGSKESKDDTVEVAENNTEVNSSKTAQENAGSSTKATDVSKLSSVLTKKKAPTRNYKKGLGSYKSMKKIKKK